MTRAHGRASLEDVAARAGVSRATVSRVVNGQSTVAEDLRARVQAVIDELGYVPNAAARTLVTRRTDTLALVASEPDVRVFGDPYFAGLIRGVSQEISGLGLQLVLLMIQNLTELERAKRYLQNAPLDGVLLISEHAADDPIPKMLVERGVPFVLGGRPMYSGLSIPFVDVDNVRGGELAAQHLTAIGRTVVGTLSGPLDMSAGRDRLAGFKRGLGRSYRAARVEEADFTQAGGEAAARRLIERVPDLDGLFAASDLTALGALAALRRAGRRVPEDVAVIGFDDNSFADTSEPPLTTVHQDPVLQGRLMVRLFMSLYRPDVQLEANEELPPVAGTDHVMLPVRLVRRAST